MKLSFVVAAALTHPDLGHTVTLMGPHGLLTLMPDDPHVLDELRPGARVSVILGDVEQPTGGELQSDAQPEQPREAKRSADAAAPAGRPAWISGPLVWSSRQRESIDVAVGRIGLRVSDVGGGAADEWTDADGTVYELREGLHQDESGQPFEIVAAKFPDGSRAIFRTYAVQQ